jgi:hypothetical protein
MLVSELVGRVPIHVACDDGRTHRGRQLSKRSFLVDLEIQRYVLLTAVARDLTRVLRVIDAYGSSLVSEDVAADMTHGGA